MMDDFQWTFTLRVPSGETAKPVPPDDIQVSFLLKCMNFKNQWCFPSLKHKILS